jgi:hypothetical protein
MAKNTAGSNGANLGFEEKLWQGSGMRFECPYEFKVKIDQK